MKGKENRGSLPELWAGPSIATGGTDRDGKGTSWLPPRVSGTPGAQDRKGGISLETAQLEQASARVKE